MHALIDLLSEIIGVQGSFSKKKRTSEIILVRARTPTFCRSWVMCLRIAYFRILEPSGTIKIIEIRTD